MSIRRTEVQKLKTGQYIMVDEEPCVIKATERSKSGKHGHAKVTITRDLSPYHQVIWFLFPR